MNSRYYDMDLSENGVLPRMVPMLYMYIYIYNILVMFSPQFRWSDSIDN